MKKIFTLAFLWVTIIATINAAPTKYGELIDLGELQLDTDYEVKGDFSNYIAHFTATTDGTLMASSTSSYSLYPYYQQLDDMESEGNAIEYTLDNMYGNKQYHFDVTAGTTYYFYLNFSMDAFTFRLSMDTGDISITKTTPEAGSVFSVSGGGLVSIQFNRAVNVNNEAKIIAGDKEATVAVNGLSNIFSLEIKEPLFAWLNDGTLKGGDKFTIRFFDVTAADDATIIYGTDGTVEIEYIIGERPIQLVGTENTSGNFKSYYLPNDPAGIVTLNFDGDVASAIVTLTFGSTDVEGDYYVEELTPVIDGGNIKIDLTGKQRTPELMVASGYNYNNMTLNLNKVFDTAGQHAYSPGQGTMGGFAFAYDELEIVTANVMCEFTPRPGSTITNETTNIEIWITDEAKLSYEGVKFATNTGTEAIVSDFAKEVDPYDETASILTVPVPAELFTTQTNSEEAATVTVTLNNLQSADGLDHSRDVLAMYYIGSTAIDKVFGDDATEFTVYNTQGILVLDTTNRDEVKNLPQGIYIINGKKFLMTR